MKATSIGAYGRPIKMAMPISPENGIERIFQMPICRKPARFNSGPAVFVVSSVLDKIRRHARSDLNNEVGGALLGYYCQDPELDNKKFVIIHEVFIASPEKNENFRAPAFMRFTHTFFRELDDYLESVDSPEGQPYTRLGMYHSHPGYGVFMSSVDRQTFLNIFSEPWHVSLIIDPRNEDIGVFVWEEEGKISDKLGFTVIEYSLTDTVDASKTVQTGDTPEEVNSE